MSAIGATIAIRSKRSLVNSQPPRLDRKQQMGQQQGSPHMVVTGFEATLPKPGERDRYLDLDRAVRSETGYLETRTSH